MDDLDETEDQINGKTVDSQSTSSEIANKVKLKYMISEMEEINEESYESDVGGGSMIGNKQHLSREKHNKNRHQEVTSVSASGAFERFLQAPLQKHGQEHDPVLTRRK